jgi:hypothetical protein
MSLWQRIRPESQSSDLGEMKCFCLWENPHNKFGTRVGSFILG